MNFPTELCCKLLGRAHCMGVLRRAMLLYEDSVPLHAVTRLTHCLMLCSAWSYSRLPCRHAVTETVPEKACRVFLSICSAVMEYSSRRASSPNTASMLNLQNFQPSSWSRSSPCMCLVWPADHSSIRLKFLRAFLRVLHWPQLSTSSDCCPCLSACRELSGLLQPAAAWWNCISRDTWPKRAKFGCCCWPGTHLGLTASTQAPQAGRPLALEALLSSLKPSRCSAPSRIPGEQCRAR